MDNNVIYKCEGTCGGESTEPKNCGDTNCTRHGKPLTKNDKKES